jgi:hypothetical protein
MGSNSNGSLCKALRDEDLEPDMPLGALAGGEGDHVGIHVAPLLAEGVGEVELVLDGDKVLGGRGVDLDGLDIRRQAFDLDAVVRCRVGDGSRR